MKAPVQFTLYLEVSELFSAFRSAGGAAVPLGPGVFFSPRGAPAPANAPLCPRGSASWTLAQIEPDSATLASGPRTQADASEVVRVCLCGAGPPHTVGAQLVRAPGLLV